ncbi:hypothetical protein V6N13_108502 [Hibiscus sabdariffa]
MVQEIKGRELSFDVVVLSTGDESQSSDGDGRFKGLVVTFVLSPDLNSRQGKGKKSVVGLDSSMVVRETTGEATVGDVIKRWLGEDESYIFWVYWGKEKIGENIEIFWVF